MIIKYVLKKTGRMQNKIRAGFLCVIVFMFCCIPLAAALDAKKINEANNLYTHEEYDQALELYNELLLKDRNSQLLNYNAGSAYYKKGDYEKAKDLFSRVLTTQDKNTEAKTAYNIGNCLFKLSQASEEKQAENALNALKEALVYYQRAIELNQKDEDAKFNYEIADRKLEMLKQQLRDQKNERQEGQGEQGEQQKKEGEEGETKSTEQNEQKEEGASEAQEVKQEEQQKKEQGEKSKESQKKEQAEEKAVKQASQEGQEMNKREAEMLIDAYGREGLRLDLADLHKSQNEPEIEKDW